MPNYQYKCQFCGNEFIEYYVAQEKQKYTECPLCNQPSRFTGNIAANKYKTAIHDPQELAAMMEKFDIVEAHMVFGNDMAYDYIKIADNEFQLGMSGNVLTNYGRKTYDA